MIDTDVIPRIKQLCVEKNMSYYRLAKESSITYSTLNNMLNRPKNIPTISTLSKICDGLDITLRDFFSDGTETTELTKSQLVVLEVWNNLDVRQQELALAYMQGLMDISKK